MLSKEWWKGAGGIVSIVGVLVAIAGLVVGLIFSLGGSSTINTNNGNCNAQGSGITVNCSSPEAKPSQ